MSRYDPGLEAGIIPGNLRAFKKDGQHLTLWGDYGFGSFAESGGGDAASSATESAADVDSFDQFSTPEESVTESLGDYEFGANYEVDVGMTPEQFDSIYGDSITQFPDSTTTSFTDAGASGASRSFTATGVTPVGPALGEGVPGEATDALINAKDSADLLLAGEASQYTISEKIGIVASKLSTNLSEFAAATVPKLAADFAKNTVVSVAKTVAGSLLGTTQVGRSLAAAANTVIDKAAAAVPNLPPRNDKGELNPGWYLNEFNQPEYLGGGFVDNTGKFLTPPPAAVPNTGEGYTIDGVLKSGFALIDGVVQDLRKLSVTDIAKLVDAKAAGLVNVVVGVANSAVLAASATPVDAIIAGLKDAGLLPTAVALIASISPRGNSAAADLAARAETLTQLTQQQKTLRDQELYSATTGDWRVRLSLAPNAGYLYNAAKLGTILAPLKNTGGVIFPYTPTISTVYKADYESYSLTHSNFRGYFYKSSYVDPINIKATFTAQDTAEANYLLAVIHFFRSVTKMFYGQDANRGAPPPLVFLTGLGQYQFNKHPCVVASFDYTLPADVNYIRSSSVFNVNGTNTLTARETTSTASNPLSYTIERLRNHGLTPGAQKDPAFLRVLGQVSSQDPPSTYVPTKMEINISLYPMQSRQQVSEFFSLTEFANGNLLRKGYW